MSQEGKSSTLTVAADQSSRLTGDARDRGLMANAAEREHFATDYLLTGLKGRAISSSIVTILAQAAQFALTLVSTMVLARLVTTQDFGLAAIVTTIIGFSRIFKAGLSTATVQREGITHAQVSNLFGRTSLWAERSVRSWRSAHPPSRGSIGSRGRLAGHPRLSVVNPNGGCGTACRIPN